MLFKFMKGRRDAIVGQSVKVPSNKWCRLKVEALGPVISCYYNGHRLFTERDDEFAEGKIGLWTKADSVTYFDDLSAKSL